METARLGGSDLDVSRVGLGCNQFGRKLDRDATRMVIEAALEVGITFFDTADVYGSGESERFIGAALGERRAAVVLGTKFGQDASVPGPGGSRDHMRRALEASLERLGTDVIDLYTYHRPDGVTRLEETLAAMQELVDEGRVRWLGLSNVDAGQVAAAASGVTVVAVQNEYSLLHRDDDGEVLPLCRRHGIGYVPYFPLASGLLTGKYRRGEPAPAGSRLAGRQIDESDLETVEALERVGSERGRSILEVAVGGLASIPGVASVIAGATSPEQVRANAAAGAWHASEDDLDAIARAVARDD